MEKIFDYKSNQEHYVSDACIVWCFDARFSDVLDEYIKRQGLQGVDRIKIAGGIKDIASPAAPSRRDYVLGQIAQSIKLHQPKKIILMAHTECGAYGGSRDPVFYETEIKKAREIASNQFQNIPVESFFADFEGLHK